MVSPTGRAPVHDLELGHRLLVLINVGPRPARLHLDDGQLHELDLEANRVKVDLADDVVSETVSVTTKQKTKWT